MNALRLLKNPMRVREPDQTLPLLADGYRWLPAQWEQTDGPMVRTRLMGRPAVAVRGPEAVRFFYEEPRIERHDALPGPVLSTLFGHGAVHTLDGRDHQVRKAMFVDLLKDPDRVEALASTVGAAWDTAAEQWTDGRRVVLFDESARLLTRAVCRWAGLPLDASRVDDVTRDLVAMVDGFATAGPRHIRARRARRRAEQGLMRLVTRIRTGERKADPGSVLDAVVHHQGADGLLIDTHTTAVELLNILRPTVAISWFVAFAGHALHEWPDQKRLLREGGEEYARAFAHEVRRHYPFAPFVAGVAQEELHHRGEPIEAGTLVLLDLYGHDHDAELWVRPDDFDPGRFTGRTPERDELIPQGGGDASAGHRCPGEDITVRLLGLLSLRLARLEYRMPAQDLRIPLERIPTRPKSGVVLGDVRYGD
ncbi:cytochrome P450 [Streptomyces indicus]|uniref:Fatty-acid peroxygenase n=1 Tax=Streptomyces indicus TaxID=417292 RepID=A0A1G8TS57_9ACTN|nr:cytochrome P450 [Streptomyces indicus]SDJ44368.1 fatty-acid peroxygenase [Streptomyces indicus]